MLSVRTFVDDDEREGGKLCTLMLRANTFANAFGDARMFDKIGVAVPLDALEARDRVLKSPFAASDGGKRRTLAELNERERNVVELCHQLGALRTWERELKTLLFSDISCRASEAPHPPDFDYASNAPPREANRGKSGGCGALEAPPGEANRGKSGGCGAVEAPPNTLGAPHPEHAYLALVREAIDHGARRVDRTGTGTRSLFGRQFRVSLRDGLFPLLTTKRVFFRGVLEELLWFVRGSTDARELAAKGVRIWDANAAAFAKTPAFARLADEDPVGVEPGVLGPVYGHQWRRFGAAYLGPVGAGPHGGVDAVGAGPHGGVDQLAEVLRLAREDPASRRNILTAWNPVDLPAMALPPCHLLSQFWVDGGALHTMVTMRSCDLGLGLPFNIASYALLSHMVAAAAGLALGDLVFSLGDTHVYEDHVAALEEQLGREVRPMPRLAPLPRREALEEYVASDFLLLGYDPHPPLAMAMSV